MLKVVMVGMPKITPQLAYKAINKFMQSCAAMGNTLLHEPGTLKSEWNRALHEDRRPCPAPHQRQPDV